MPLSYRTRRRLALLILLVGMPLYVVAAVTVVGLLGRPPFWLELAVYVGLGVLWTLPFRGMFRGVGQPDPQPDPNSPTATNDQAKGPGPCV